MATQRNVLVTGASRGLGEAIAREFWKEGANLILAARSVDKLHALRDALLAERPDGMVWTLATDLSNPASGAQLIAAARNCVPRLDVLINNAAIVGPIGRFWDNDPAAWHEAIQVNLLSPAEIMRAALPWMAANNDGVIINLSGGGATSPRPNFSAYATAKAALVRLSETIAVEAEPFGVRVHCVAPGAMNTEMLEAVLRASPDAVGPEFAKAQQQKNKGGADPSVAARLCLYLASAEARQITGRLFSAVWDPWQKLADLAGDLKTTDIYTLRRIVPSDRGKDWE